MSTTSDETSTEAPQDIPWQKAPYTAFSGFCMGTADVVPGVSGGTMAVALGIYHQLLGAITSIDKEALSRLLKLDLKGLFSRVQWRFLASLFAGVLLGVALMVKVIKLPTMVLAKSPERPYVYAVFFGMILASTFALGRHVGRWSAARAAMVAVGAAVGFAVVNLVPVDTPEHPAFIFLCGSVAICAMLLPGISGSFILLILGKYAYILGALGKLKLTVILPFVAGCLVGLLAFSRLLKWLLDRWHDTVLAGLIGLLFGSLWRIWPYQHLTEKVIRHKPRVVGAKPYLPESLDLNMLGLFALGIGFVVAIEVYASRRKAKSEAAAQSDIAAETASSD
jgi:putative membrane protein